MFGFRRGSKGSNYTQVYLAFFLCGMLHWAGNVAVDSTSMWPGTMQFFMGQAVGITLEDFVVWVAEPFVIKTRRQSGMDLHPFWRYLGYAWVALWFGLTAPYFLDDVTLIGLMAERPGVSLVQGLAEGRWIVG